MPFVKFVGRIRYSGFDGTVPVNAVAGGIIEVSQKKAEQLLTDFPKDWKELKDADAKSEIESVKNAAQKEVEKVRALEKKKEEEIKNKRENSLKAKRKKHGEDNDPFLFDKESKLKKGKK